MKFLIAKEYHDEALRRAQAIPPLSNSHRGFDAVCIGCLGELVFERFLDEHGITYESHLRQTSHDYLVGEKKLIFEVKTKDRTVAPRPHYECSAPLYNYDHQAVDAYAFFSLQREKGNSRGIDRFRTCWFVGLMSRDKLERVAVLRKKGQTDPRNGTTFWTDCLNVYIRDLSSAKEMVNYLGGSENSATDFR